MIFGRVMAFSGYKDIDFTVSPNFSSKFLLIREEEKQIEMFFTPELIQFFESKQVYHVKSDGEALLIFNKFKPVEQITPQ